MAAADEPFSESELFWTWLTTGIDAGWVSAPVCATHDGVPGTSDEDDEWDDGGDPCQHVVRLWPNP